MANTKTKGITKTSDVETVTLKYDAPRWGDYNRPQDNERKAELPIGAWFLEKFDHDVIEIGEVMNSHIPCTHTIYDPRAEMPGTISKDARELDYKGKNVLSISTIEHVGDGDIDLIKKIQKQAKNYIITFPVGFNQDFDQRVSESNIEYFVIERSLDDKNTWTQITDKDLSGYKYNDPYYAGHAIVVITNLNVVFKFKH